MTTKLLSIPRFNSVYNFNFFFPNSKRNLRIEQSFISNQFLSSRFRNHFTKSNELQSQNFQDCENISTFENVASKVLSCQELGSKLSQSLKQDANSKSIPFTVIPKANSVDRNTYKEKNLRSLISPYLKLTKPNLTILVTLSSICSYAISPNSVSVSELALLTLGTALCSGSANAINMGREPEFDRKMSRTSTRPVVKGLVTPYQAYQFAGVTGVLGCSILYFGVNLTVAFLGLLNIVLYAWVYTSLKRKSILNTWVGAIVGAIPPLMGWAASSSLYHPGSWCLAALLYAWQFPHFNALSHNVADQYKKAGYVMTAAENPRLNARVALRYSLLMFPICFGLSYFGATDWFFQVDSAIANAWLTLLAFRFWKQQRINHAPNHIATIEGIEAASFHARKLFWCSVWQLPVVLVLAMLHKKGQWDRLWHYLGFKVEKKEANRLRSI